MRILLVVSALALLACGGDGLPPGSAAGAALSPAGHTTPARQAGGAAMDCASGMMGGGMTMGGEDSGGMMGGGMMGGGPSGDGAAGSGAPPPSGGGLTVGDACSTETSCPVGGSGAAACLAEWPGGYCAVRGCSVHGHDCPGDPGQGLSGTGSKCVLAPESMCLKLCTQDSDCRDAYACIARPDAAGHGTAQVCVPRA